MTDTVPAFVKAIRAQPPVMSEDDYRELRRHLMDIEQPLAVVKAILDALLRTSQAMDGFKETVWVLADAGYRECRAVEDAFRALSQLTAPRIIKAPAQATETTSEPCQVRCDRVQAADSTAISAPKM
jgi:hypothetical protein